MGGLDAGSEGSSGGAQRGAPHLSLDRARPWGTEGPPGNPAGGPKDVPFPGEEGPG